MSAETPRPWWEREPVSYVADAERLKRDATALFDACVGPADDVAPLDWLSGLLVVLRESGPREDFEDPEACWEALHHSEKLVRDLRAAIEKAKGRA